MRSGDEVPCTRDKKIVRMDYGLRMVERAGILCIPGPLLKNKKYPTSGLFFIFGLEDHRASARKRKSKTFSFVSLPTVVERAGIKPATSAMRMLRSIS